MCHPDLAIEVKMDIDLLGGRGLVSEAGRGHILYPHRILVNCRMDKFAEVGRWQKSIDRPPELAVAPTTTAVPHWLRMNQKAEKRLPEQSFVAPIFCEYVYCL